MSDQVQIFWDSYLKALVIEFPDRRPSPSQPPPIVVSPDHFQAPPTRAATSVMDSNAPLGSFYNPIPYPSEVAATGAVQPVPVNSPDPASQTPVHPPLWPQDSSAPLGSFSNPYPHGSPLPPVAAMQAPTPTPAPAISPPAPDPTPSQPTFEPAWQPTAADFDEMFNHATSNPSPVTTPGGPSAMSNTTEVYDEAERRRILNEIVEEIIIQQSISRRTSPPPLPPPPRSQSQPQSSSSTPSLTPSTRQVHFQNKGSHLQATQAAAARAAERARQNEAEVLGFIDADEANRLRSTYRRPPTPMTNPGSAFQPSTAPSTTSPYAPHSPNSSTESVIDTLSQPGSPIPASPLRNPGFSTSAAASHASRANNANNREGEREFERWPLCTICEDRPVTIRKGGLGFCDGCFGRACAAEEGRRGRGERR